MSHAVSPRSLPEAMGRLGADPGLVPAAGCTDLMVGLMMDLLPGMNGSAGEIGDQSRPAAREPRAVLDLLRIPELRGIRVLSPLAGGDGALEIGAAVTFSEIRRSPRVRQDYPALAAAAAVVGGWQIQNRATLGGNIANASPAGDSLPVLLALDATVVVAGPGGEREVPYADFHLGYRRTALRAGELIARVRLPTPPAGTIQLFRKVGTREAQAISKVVVAMAAWTADGRVAGLRLAVGSVAPTPVRLTAVEQALAGQAPGPAAAALAGRLAAAAVEPIDDVRSTADYRRFALERVVRRMVLKLG